MIDVEIDVFDYVYQQVAELLPDDCFQSVYVQAPPALPFATLMEMDNITDKRNRSSARDEDYAVLTYEANVYDTTKGGCRDVMNALNDAMTHLGFMRTMCQFIPNLADNTIFRYTARYQAVADGNKVIYRKY